jgi:septum formation protein
MCPSGARKSAGGRGAAPRDLPVLGRIPLLSLTVKCWRNRAMPNTRPHAAHAVGQTHQVMTAVALADSSRRWIAWWSRRSPSGASDDIADYVASGEPLDKAGAYGIQGLGGCFVRKINGSYHAVVGLPLVETYELLSNFNSLREKRDKDDG